MHAGGGDHTRMRGKARAVERMGADRPRELPGSGARCAESQSTYRGYVLDRPTLGGASQRARAAVLRVGSLALDKDFRGWGYRA